MEKTYKEQRIANKRKLKALQTISGEAGDDIVGICRAPNYKYKTETMFFDMDVEYIDFNHFQHPAFYTMNSINQNFYGELRNQSSLTIRGTVNRIDIDDWNVKLPNPVF